MFWHNNTQNSHDKSKIHLIIFSFFVQIHSFSYLYTHILLLTTVCDLLCKEKWMTERLGTQNMQCVKGSRFSSLMLLMSSALQWDVMIDMSSGENSSFLSSFSTDSYVFRKNLMTSCRHLYDYYSYQYRSTGYWLHLRNDSVDSQLCAVVTKALEAAYNDESNSKDHREGEKWSWETHLWVFWSIFSRPQGEKIWPLLRCMSCWPASTIPFHREGSWHNYSHKAQTHTEINP